MIWKKNINEIIKLQLKDTIKHSNRLIISCEENTLSDNKFEKNKSYIYYNDWILYTKKFKFLYKIKYHATTK